MNDTIEGIVAVIKSRKDYCNISNGVILIAKNTHPDIVIVIDRIKGIITEVDNKLCHAAIIAREFNKPLLMGVNNATGEFRTGDKVLVDFCNRIIKKIK